MSAHQLDLLLPGQAAELLRKRSFWKRTLWISLAIGAILTVHAISSPLISMIGAFSTLQQTGAADPAVLAGDVSEAMLIALWSLPPACVAFLIAMVSFIRLLSLPKVPKE